MTTIYRYYNQEELDRQYFIRGTVPDITPIIHQYTERTKKNRQTVPCFLDIPYGQSKDEYLDIFQPCKNIDNAPVFVFIHGGFWKALTTADSGFMAKAFTDQGACVVVVNYALAPEASLDEITHQCRQALVWTFNNISNYGGNPDQIYISGSSAGGHLSAMVLGQDWMGNYDEPTLKIKGAVLLSGIYDLEPIIDTHINEWAKLDYNSAVRNSPIHSLPHPYIPLIFSYAPNETEEFKMQTERFMSACNHNGNICQFITVLNSNHFDIVFELANPQSQLCKATFEMMGIK